MGRPRFEITRAALASAALFAASAALAGCATHAPPPLSEKALAPTRAMRDLTIFWVGRRFEGIALTAADRPEDYIPGLGLRMYYGDCGHHPLFSSGGCTLPLEVNSMIYRAYPNTKYLGPQHQTSLRGVPAIVYDKGHSIELYTGRIAVDVYADSPRRARAAVQALTTLNVATVTESGSRLPAPVLPLGPPPGAKRGSWLGPVKP